MPLAPNLKFSCATLPTANGYELKGLTPDANGCYQVVLGCVGAPTRANVIYESNSLIKCMRDPDSRFNICLRDGNLFGEWGHPVIRDQKDMDRLLQIDEKYISHVFNRIWVDENPIMLHGIEGFPIRAVIKPCGPYGDVLEKSLRDPQINTSFSIRSLCTPATGPKREYEYRQVQIVVTFDAVHAPGFEMATKRYNVPGNESFGIGRSNSSMRDSDTEVSRATLENAVKSHAGMESNMMLTDIDIRRIYDDKDYTIDGQLVASGIAGTRSIRKQDNTFGSAAALLYRR